MLRRIGRIGLALALASTYLLQISAPAAQAANVVFSGAFVNGSTASSTIVTAWETFRSQLTGSYNSFTWSSTNGSSITVTDAVKVQTLASNLRSGTATNVTIGSDTWYVGLGCGSTAGYTVIVEFANVGTCTGSSTYSLRPLIGNSNWGGSGGVTAGAASQTITLTFFENAPSATTFSTTQTTPTNIAAGGTISYSLVLSQSVTDLVAGDFQFGDTASCNTPVVTGSGTIYTVTVTNCTQGNLILQLKANSVTGSTTTGPSSIASANTIVIDRTAPTISSVTGPANSTYIPGNTLSFTMNMSETVTVTGTPRLTLTVGSTTRYATYSTGTNTKTLTFVYTVPTALSDVDTDGVAISTTLDLNAGSITDLATNTLSVLTFTAPTLTSVLVAQKPAAPSIDSISATSTQLSVNFTAGSNNGSAITNYEYSTNNGANWTTRSPVATSSPIVITSLTNGQSYPVRIRAVNAAGSGDSSTAVNGTPTAVVVGGGSNISITYGQSASSSQFTATGGTGIYTYTLSSTPSGVSINNAIVSVDSTTAAGTYTLNVIATDNAGSPQSGVKQIVITIAKATTTITIALPNSATYAALGGAITITATVSKPGSVNFKLGGTTISGCGSAAASSTTAVCTWTPNSLGSASLTAIFTPTDASNYETFTTTTLSITVVNGVSTITISLTGGVLVTPKSQAINIIAVVGQAGKVTFLADGKRIPGCYNVNASAGNKSCSWKPTTQKFVTLTAALNPTNSAYENSNARLIVQVVRRTGTR
jgi:hypothetical protein